MAEMPHGHIDISEDMYEDEFYAITDDPSDEMINIAFVERGLVMRFDYEEFVEFVKIVERVRPHVQQRLENPTGTR